MQRYFGRILGKQVVLGDDDIFHLTRVMRARIGDKIEVVSEGQVFLCQVNNLKPIEIDIIKKLKENNELPNKVILIASLIKGEKMDFVLQKATELGVFEIILMETERTVVKLKQSEKDAKFERYRRILKEAAEQSKRTVIPTLYRLIDVSLLKSIDADVKLIAYEDEAGSSGNFIKAVNSLKDKQTLAIVIGPEGGFSVSEVEEAMECGYMKVGLGRRILRAETASLYALSVIGSQLEKK